MEVSLQSRVRVVGTSLLLFFVALFLTAYSSRNRSVAKVGSVVIQELLFPIQVANKFVQGGISNIWSNYIALVGVREENEKMQSRVRELEVETLRLRKYATENRELKLALGIQSEKRVRGMVAEIIGFDASGWAQVISVDKGSRDGVQEGMAVLRGDGVVGQVIAVALTSSRVLLITDNASGVDALIKRIRARGVVVGALGSDCEMNYVEKEIKVQKGDVVVTSGMDGIYPKGFIIGEIVRVGAPSDSMFHTLRVRPHVDLNRLEVVTIVLGVEQQEITEEESEGSDQSGSSGSETEQKPTEEGGVQEGEA